MNYQTKYWRIAILINVLVGLTTSLGATDSLAEYAGSFQIDGKTTLIVRESSEGLRGEIPNRPEFRLVATGNDRFDIVGIQVNLVFLRNRQGSIYAVEIRQPLTDVVATRVESDAMAGDPSSETEMPTGVDVPVETLQRYVGRYVTMGFYVVQVTLDDAKLFFQAPGHDQYPLVALSESSFQIVGRPATVEFKLDGEGPAGQMLLHENNKVKALRRVKFQSQPQQ